MPRDDRVQKARREPPVVAAVFPEERLLWQAVAALEAREIGRDFIGVNLAGSGAGMDGTHPACALSVFAARRRHDEITALLTECGATAVGGSRAIAEAHGVVAHPGLLDDHGTKLPMGSEYAPKHAGR